MTEEQKRTLHVLCLASILSLSFIFVGIFNDYIPYPQSAMALPQVFTQPPPSLLVAAAQQSQMQTYENSTYGIKMVYPANWPVYGYGPNSWGSDKCLRDVANFGPASTNAAMGPSAYYPDLLVSLDYCYGQKKTLNDYVQGVVLGNNNTRFYKDFKVISVDTNSVLSGQPAYKVLTRYISTIDDQSKYGVEQVLETGLIIGGKVYIISYYASPTLYPTMLPAALKMINSFEITNATS